MLVVLFMATILGSTSVYEDVEGKQVWDDGAGF